ncbi:MAG: T9SS type A sorting domain-containing protein [Ignavibacteriaceae bacterium]|nr:T9SS type A sorting domain-containing protein [Ignavibacteriaceae bacterium]
MQIIKYFLIVLICTVTYSQTTPEGGQAVYELVPGSKNNLVELSFSNKSKNEKQTVSITVQEAPEWITFSNDEVNIENINSLRKETAQFSFNVSENAPLGEEGKIIFRITKDNAGVITKTYNIRITAPEIFEVYQNYPNPFNPTTTIKYSIPQDAFVSIKIFNVLGEKITELKNKEMKTGIHKTIFNASSFSSGFYFYIVEAKGSDGTKYFDSKKMILLK